MVVRRSNFIIFTQPSLKIKITSIRCNRTLRSSNKNWWRIFKKSQERNMIRIAVRKILMQIISIWKSQGLAIYNYLRIKSIINLKLKRNIERPPTLLPLGNMEPFHIPVWWPKCRLKHKPKRIKRPKLAVAPRASLLLSILTPTMKAITRSSITTLSTTTLP